MAVGVIELGELTPVAGIRLGTAAAGIKKPGRDDILLIEAAPGSRCAAVFTRNAFCAAPVLLAREHLSQTAPRYLLVNSGNANAGTGEPGLAAARASCAAVAELGDCAVEAVLPFSTGVIGEPLPVDRISAALPTAFASLGDDNWATGARAIMTTDTVPKGVSRRISLTHGEVTLTGICKGSGMIRPDMATMLAYLATDADIAPEALRAALSAAVAVSFNRITVDGDTSTNDACVLLASGQAKNECIDSTAHADYAAFASALAQVCEDMARLMVRDGEGATRLMTVEVRGGRDAAECDAVAYTVAHSPLVKTALFAGDPNWGRILAAVGRAGLDDLDIRALEIHLNDVRIVSGGGRDPDYTEARGQAVMEGEEVLVRIDLKRGDACCRVWTCDFSYDYVRINAEYRS